MKNCFYCEKEILENEGKIYPLDRPYVNLWVHRVCSDAITQEWLLENYQRILDYTGSSPVKTKTKRK
jgi:hypothetical protein